MMNTTGRLTAALALLCSAALHAAPITVFGEDLNGSDMMRIARPNAMAARMSFLGGLGTSGTEDFESFPAFQFPPATLAFGSIATGAVTGSMMTSTFLLEDVPPTNAGRFPTSGEVYWEAGGPFAVAFSRPVQAIGFFATDLGDQGGRLQLTLTRTDGMLETLLVPHSLGATGSALFFGLRSPDMAYTSVSFAVQGSTAEVYGLDDLTVGTVVPEPSTMVLLGVGLGLLAWRRARAT